MHGMLPLTTDLLHADFLNGALLAVDKPAGWTSFDVVNKVRGLLRKKYNTKNIKVGHSGTLDPMATGLLLICTGKWTKELQQLTGLDKKYQGQITLGIETETYDAEGEIISKQPVPDLTKNDLAAMLKNFFGDIDQYPPAYSAIKKDGKKLYELARAGKEVKTESRKVTVYDIQLLNFNSPMLDILLHCGSGFYVRSLAHDLGKVIGCGAHLSSLRRTAIGEYAIDNAFTVEEFDQLISS
jgi:tRNA pseudouridine55 synthase